MGSTKEKILREIQRAKLKNIIYIGSHPMAGDHQTGLEAARGNLYDESLVFITRDRVPVGKIRLIEQIWRSVGANRLISISAKDHDRIIGEVSHVPHLISSALVSFSDPTHALLSGQGFRDVTRIAQGDPDLWVGIISTNRYMAPLLKKFGRQISKIQKLIKTENWAQLKKLLKEARKIRQGI